jgi:dTDP-4-dehydrorhamnose reductase
VAAFAETIRRWRALGGKYMTLVFGKSGQVAKELQNLGSVSALSRDEVDLLDPQSCADAIRLHSPPAVINAAAFTAVDSAEDNETIANIINGDAPKAMAEACAELAIPFVHISTDYVFDGTGHAAWRPDDQTAPQNAYGRSKLYGEKGIIESGAIYTILRTSWVVSAYGTNFVKTMLRLSETRDNLNIVDDQIGGPTPAYDIAMACLEIKEQLLQDASKSGIYHFSGTPDVSWAGLAQEIFYQAKKSVAVTPILTSNYYTPAKRPLNSRIDCASTEKTFGIMRPNWRSGIKIILQALQENE